MGLDADGNIIYGHIGAYQGQQVVYTGTCFILKGGKPKVVPCPSAALGPPKGTKGPINCPGVAFETWNWVTLEQTQAKLKSCTELKDPKKDCPQECDKKCYFWTFKVHTWDLDPTGKPIEPGSLSKTDFHIVCASTATGNCISKDGHRPLDPRVGPPEVFTPGPYQFLPTARKIEKIENLELQVYCCKAKDLKK